MTAPELTKAEKAKHSHHELKAKARHHEIIEALNEFTIFAMELMNLEKLSPKAQRRVVFHVGRLRRLVIQNSRGNVSQSLHASAAIEKLQIAVHYLANRKKREISP